MRPCVPLQRLKDHLVIDHHLDDVNLELYLSAAIDRCVQEIGLAGLLETTRTDTLAAQVSTFPLPVASVVSVKLGDADLPATAYTLTGNFDTGSVLTIADEHWDAARVAEYAVTWEPGFSEVPSWFTVAVLFLAAHYYENRAAVIVGQGVSAMEVPLSAQHLLRPHRRHWFA